MFKVAGPLWAQATAGGDNVFARLIKSGKKVLRRVLQKDIEPAAGREIPKPTWSLKTRYVQVGESSRRLIGGLFPKQALKTQAAETRRQAALRLIRDSRKVPVFAFVGLSLGASLDQKKEATDDVLCSGIRDLFQQYGVKEARTVESDHNFSLETLQLGQLIGKGCNAAVYEARPRREEEEKSVAESCVQEKSDQSSQGSEDQAPTAVDHSDSKSNVDSAGLVNSEDVEDAPPVIFHTESHLDFPTASDDDDDISIISDEDALDPDPGGNNIDLDGWVLYRVCPAATAYGLDEVSDSDSDIFILAGDEDELESIPDLDSFELDWSMVGAFPPDVESRNSLSAESSGSLGDNSISTTVSTGSSYTAGSTSTTVATDDPEPAPDIDGCPDYPLAVKMMFNYEIESQTDRILSAMSKETVPAQSDVASAVTGVGSQQTGKKKLPAHPNIVAMHGVFVDQTPDLAGGSEAYPSALPPRLNKESGLGRNATMFLVMKKYTMTLREYLAIYSVSCRTRCLLFAQLLEGVAHLGNHGIAHRDLKSDNILIDLSQGTEHPFLAISDFGCCLADRTYGLKLPYWTGEVDKGGNCALMAPEIKCAEPGVNGLLDYTKADLWAAGALAYEIFGDGNPFYAQLDARYYCEEHLPLMAEGVPKGVQRLTELLLRRYPSKRPTPTAAATAMQLLLWTPTQLQPFATQHLHGYSPLWKCKELCHWLEQLTMETVCQRVFGGGISSLELLVKSTFLSRVTRQDIFAVVALD